MCPVSHRLQTVGDAISDLLMVEAILALRNMDAKAVRVARGMGNELFPRSVKRRR